MDTLQPGIMDNYKKLKDKIKEQKDENELLYKHLLNLKKESNDVSIQRLERLEKVLGQEEHSNQPTPAVLSDDDEVDQTQDIHSLSH